MSDGEIDMDTVLFICCLEKETKACEKRKLLLPSQIWLSVPNKNHIHKFTHTTKFHDLTNNSIEPTFEKQRCNTQNRNSSVNMSSYFFVSTQVSITNFKPN